MADRPVEPLHPWRPEGGDRESPSGELTAGTSSGPGQGRAGPSDSLSGTTVDHFEVLELLGAGGFGEVYRARDTRLGRMVAVKVLPAAFARSEERRERFRREALAASALNHPNICTVYQLVEEDGRYLIVMELVEGKTLAAALKDGPMPVERILPIALQITEALGEAHHAGILHRDVKPGNIAVTPQGRVKVLDFGLAKIVGSAADAERSTLESLTAEGATSGTLEYMSPEQLLGKPVDRRSDLFSLGVVLYAMAAGQLPFQGHSAIAVANAILYAEPKDFGGAPDGLKAIVRRLLEKEPGKRYAEAGEVRAALKALENSPAPARNRLVSRNTRIGLVLAILAASAVAGWLWHRWSRQRWAGDARTEIARLVEAEDFTKAFVLAREALTVLPRDPALETLWSKVSIQLSVESAPPGAEVSIRPIRGDPEIWERLGNAPLARVRRGKGIYVLRVAAAGHLPAFRICYARFGDPPAFVFHLDREGTIPAGMVRIPGGKAGDIQLDDYLMDRHEVTNEDYKAFVDAGGYQKPELWKQPFVRDGRTLSWDEALASFRDTTNRPGPAGWELGAYPAGLGRHPVTGVSWYEAAAYAEFVEKSLPTASHWTRAAMTWDRSIVVPGSNFTGSGTVAVGGAGAMNEFGTFDMAGNAKEWCWNERTDHLRVILGGGFGEPSYMFDAVDAQPCWQRRPNFGFRCAKLFSKAPEAALKAVAVPPSRDFSKEKPVSDEAFRAYKGLYAYDRRDLAVQVEATETSDGWTTEKVTFDAGYGSERVVAYLFLPRNARPPFQPVVFFPGGPAVHTSVTPALPQAVYVNFIPQSGRALLWPVFKGTYQRSDALDDSTEVGSASWRDHAIAWGKDLQRSVDFLATRKEIEIDKLAYLGFSWGGCEAPVMLAVEERFKVAILVSGGLDPERFLPEVEPFNFGSRVRLPILMLGGRYDHVQPLETSQLPLFRLFGTPEKDKRHVVYEAGHAPPRKEVIRESLDWLDRYLGPVKR